MQVGCKTGKNMISYMKTGEPVIGLSHFAEMIKEVLFWRII